MRLTQLIATAAPPRSSGVKSGNTKSPLPIGVKYSQTTETQILPDLTGPIIHLPDRKVNDQSARPLGACQPATPYLACFQLELAAGLMIPRMEILLKK